MSVARSLAVPLVLASVFVHVIALQNITKRHLLRRLDDESASASQESESSSEDPVDVVFTWVHTLRKSELAELKALCESHQEAMNPQRYRDNGGFVFSLQAALHALPWVRTFWIVTSNGHCPCWTGRVLQSGSESNALSFNGRQDVVRCVAHGSIFENAADLPTFNSLAIEAELHKIPGLAEHFIYLNDDMFLGPRQVQRSFFFTDDMTPIPASGTGKLVVAPHCDRAEVIAAFKELVGKAQTLGVLKSDNATNHAESVENERRASFVAGCLRRGANMAGHGYYVARRSIALAVQFVWKHDFHRIRASQCRGYMSPNHAKVMVAKQELVFAAEDTPFWVYNWIGQGTGQFAVGAAHQIPFLHPGVDPHAFYRHQLSAPPDFFVCNDDFNKNNAGVYQKQITEYHDFLIKMYKDIVVPISSELVNADCEDGDAVYTTKSAMLNQA